MGMGLIRRRQRRSEQGSRFGSRPLENLRTALRRTAVLRYCAAIPHTSPVWARSESTVKPRATPSNHAASKQ